MSYKLDAEESVPFEYKGNKYKLRIPVTEDIERLNKADGESAKADVVFSMVESVGDSPDFVEEMRPKMNVKEIKKFTEMVTSEFGG